jgi:hypothetical protein
MRNFGNLTFGNLTLKDCSYPVYAQHQALQPPGRQVGEETTTGEMRSDSRSLAGLYESADYAHTELSAIQATGAIRI